MMHRFRRIAIAAIAVVGFTSFASAAPQVYRWTGFYLGGNLGYSWGNGDSTYNDPGYPISVSGSQTIDGVIGGGQIGYNWQANNRWVFGLEADFQGSGEKGSNGFARPNVDVCGDGCLAVIGGTLESKILWFGTLRGRVGVLINPALWLYGTGGLTYGRISASGNIAESFTPASWSFGTSANKVGWTLGAGIEGAISHSRDWSWKLEYLFIDFGSVGGNGRNPVSGSAYRWSTKVTDNILRVGVNHRFP